MRLKISEGNNKLGKIANLSMPPGLTCVPGIPCLSEGCYAMKAYRLYPNVQNAWTSNLELWESNPGKFFSEFSAWLTKKKPERFRLFTGGDMPSEEFLTQLMFVATNHPETGFLVFTKRYDYDYGKMPDNLKVVLSIWPGVKLPTNTDLPWAWLEEDPRRRKTFPHYVCPGGCDACPHLCWDKLSTGMHLVFQKH